MHRKKLIRRNQIRPAFCIYAKSKWHFNFLLLRNWYWASNQVYYLKGRCRTILLSISMMVQPNVNHLQHICQTIKHETDRFPSWRNSPTPKLVYNALLPTGNKPTTNFCKISHDPSRTFSEQKY